MGRSWGLLVGWGDVIAGLGIELPGWRRDERDGGAVRNDHPRAMELEQRHEPRDRAEAGRCAVRVYLPEEHELAQGNLEGRELADDVRDVRIAALEGLGDGIGE